MLLHHLAALLIPRKHVCLVFCLVACSIIFLPISPAKHCTNHCFIKLWPLIPPYYIACHCWGVFVSAIFAVPLKVLHPQHILHSTKQAQFPQSLLVGCLESWTVRVHVEIGGLCSRLHWIYWLADLPWLQRKWLPQMQTSPSQLTLPSSHFWHDLYGCPLQIFF